LNTTCGTTDEMTTDQWFPISCTEKELGSGR